MKLPVVKITMPSSLDGVSNGDLPEGLLRSVGKGGKLHVNAARAFEALRADAKKHGFDLVYTWGGTYRPLSAQVSLFERRYDSDYVEGRNVKTGSRTWNGHRYYKKKGVAAAATPGKSNHGWGLAVDMALDSDRADGLDPDDAVYIGPALRYLSTRAAEFGWSWELPKTEPWHLRYVAGDNIPAAVREYERLLAAGVTKIVFSSSASVYGTPETVPITEAAPIRPENVYAESKAMMERVIGWYGETRGLHGVSLRYFNAAGASFDGVIGENWSQTTNLVPLVMKAALGASGPVRIFGNDFSTPDGSGVRDYIHVEDLASAHIAAIDYLDHGGTSTAVNLGTGSGTSVFDIIRRTGDIAGREVPHEVVGRRPGDPAMVYADASLAKELFGWRARYGIDEIIDSAFRWHSSLR